MSLSNILADKIWSIRSDCPPASPSWISRGGLLGGHISLAKDPYSCRDQVGAYSLM
jgi:hypothetical protein